MHFDRTRFLALAGAGTTTGLVRYPVGAAEFNYKLALNILATAGLAVRLIEAFDKIGQATQGRLDVKVFAGGQLGSSTELLSQLRLGAIEFTFPTDFDSSTIFPAAAMTALPFIVADRKRAQNILSGPFGNYVHAGMAKLGIYQFTRSWDLGYLDFQTSVHPVYVPADLKGLKVRTTAAATERAVFQAAGATPVAIAPPEMYAALQTHLIDGTTLNYDAVESFKTYELTKYFSLTHHAWGGRTVMANMGAWQRLPKGIQDVVSREIELARNAANDDIVQSENAAGERLRSKGMVFNNTDGQAFRKMVKDAGLFAQWKAAYGEAWPLLERSIGGPIA